ncbi:hypothetical protein OPT61_g7884 [Boeremia exigua]|uniref:Uncharacterized protein n=1 Tax=Boeremia exigua TaxID=749465 RepID=A0ACC2I1G1_9PLEO|nr:hypothetical protein OPT61_g7884 [Boeremia exigua]
MSTFLSLTSTLPAWRSGAVDHANSTTPYLGKLGAPFELTRIACGLTGKDTTRAFHNLVPSLGFRKVEASVPGVYCTRDELNPNVTGD